MILAWPYADYVGRQLDSGIHDGNNPVLRDGEMGIDPNTGVIKRGDGATAWNTLPALNSGSGGGTPSMIDGGTP